MKKVIDECSSDGTNDTSVSKQIFVLKQVITQEDVDYSNKEAGNTITVARNESSTPNSKRYVLLLVNFTLLYSYYLPILRSRSDSASSECEAGNDADNTLLQETATVTSETTPCPSKRFRQDKGVDKRYINFFLKLRKTI